MRALSPNKASRFRTWFTRAAMLALAVLPLPTAMADEPFGDRVLCGNVINHPDSVTRCVSQTGNIQFYSGYGFYGQARWYVDGVLAWTDPDKAAHESTYNHTGRESATIRCKWSEFACPDAWSNEATLTVLHPPFLTTHPFTQNKCVGSSVTFTVGAVSNDGSMSYQWKKGTANLSDAAGKVSGSKTATLTISNLVAADAAGYQCVISNSCGSTTSLAAALILASPIEFVASPTSLALCLGAPASLTVNVAGASPSTSYQWRKGTTNVVDGSNISGATSATLNIASVQVADLGSYSCVVTQGLCSAQSPAAALTFLPGPAITEHPQSTTVCSGTTVNLFVTASDTTALTYQWTRNDVNVIDGSGFSGATTRQLRFTANANTAGVYTCIVRNACSYGTMTQGATLTVNSAPTITAQPQPQTRCLGADAVFSVAATSPLGITYRWKKGTALLSNVAGQISGATTSTLTLAAIDDADLGDYSCVVSNSCSNVTTIPATLTVQHPPVITTHPVDVRACSGNVTFSVAATSGSAMTYRWRRNGTNLNDAAGQISGATSPTLTINKDSTDIGQYTCVVSNGCGSTISNAAELANMPAPVITTHPVSVTTCDSQNVSFTVAVNHPAPIYEWKLGTTILVNTPGAISGATTATLTVLNAQLTSAGSYTCTVRSCPTDLGVTSSAAVLTVKSDPWIQVQASSITRCSGADATFTIQVAGQASYLPQTYQWKKGATVLANIPGQISGATTLSLTLHAVDSSDAGSYTCVVTNDCGVEISQARTLTVNTGPSITQQPSPLTLCAGNSNATFTVVASGTPAPTYRWQRNAQNLSNIAGEIAGATSASLTLTGIDAIDAATYRCVITNSCGSTTSTDAVLIVNAGPSITSHPQNASGCASTPASFSITTDDLSPDYQWQWLPLGSATWLDLTNGDNDYENGPRLTVSGATDSTLSITPLAGAGSLASFRCVLGNTCSSTTSDPATIQICVSDLTCDGLVEDADFSVFIVAYNTLDCADPIMPANCPADLNRDGVVDDSDFQAFVRAYDELICFAAER